MLVAIFCALLLVFMVVFCIHWAGVIQSQAKTIESQENEIKALVDVSLRWSQWAENVAAGGHPSDALKEIQRVAKKANAFSGSAPK